MTVLAPAPHEAAPRLPTTGRSVGAGLAPTPLLPDGYKVPASRWTHPSVRMRELLRTEPYLFGPGVYDPFGAQLVMHHGFKAVYFSGYSFAIGHLGTTDMDLYSGPEIADGARRTVAALRKYQLTSAVGDPEKGVAPLHLDIPPVIVDMDAGYGNIFNVQRQTELLVTAGVAAAHLEDQVLPKRCGHIGGKALVPTTEMIGKLRMMRAVADDLGNPEFVVIARTDGLSAVDAPQRGLHVVEPVDQPLDEGQHLGPLRRGLRRVGEALVEGDLDGPVRLGAELGELALDVGAFGLQLLAELSQHVSADRHPIPPSR